jgi:hypothetical protein
MGGNLPPYITVVLFTLAEEIRVNLERPRKPKEIGQVDPVPTNEGWMINGHETVLVLSWVFSSSANNCGYFSCLPTYYSLPYYKLIMVHSHLMLKINVK